MADGRFFDLLTHQLALLAQSSVFSPEESKVLAIAADIVRRKFPPDIVPNPLPKRSKSPLPQTMPVIVPVISPVTSPAKPATPKQVEALLKSIVMEMTPGTKRSATTTKDAYTVIRQGNGIYSKIKLTPIQTGHKVATIFSEIAAAYLMQAMQSPGDAPDVKGVDIEIIRD